jgi:hypothetical protein
VFRIRDPVLFLPLGSGSEIHFFRISDPAFFGWNFLTGTLSSESLLCYLYETGLLLKLNPETVSSKKKVCLLLLTPFFTGHKIRDTEWKNSRIRDKTSRIRNTGWKVVFLGTFVRIYVAVAATNRYFWFGSCITCSATLHRYRNHSFLDLNQFLNTVPVLHLRYSICPKSWIVIVL